MTKQLQSTVMPGGYFQRPSLFIIFAVFLYLSGGCNNDECASNKDCNGDMLCVQGGCVSPAAHNQPEDGPLSGGESVSAETPQKSTDNDTDDTETASTPNETDSSLPENTALDTAFGTPFNPDDTDLQNLLPLGCVTYHETYYSCTPTSYVTVGMCDLVNDKGCSGALFPESCKLLMADENSVSLITICYSALDEDVPDPPEYDCVDAGGEWLPCPY